MSSSNNEVPEGATDLMSLFEPPNNATNSKAETKAKEDCTSSNKTTATTSTGESSLVKSSQEGSSSAAHQAATAAANRALEGLLLLSSSEKRPRVERPPTAPPRSNLTSSERSSLLLHDHSTTTQEEQQAPPQLHPSLLNEQQQAWLQHDTTTTTMTNTPFTTTPTITNGIKKHADKKKYESVTYRRFSTEEQPTTMDTTAAHGLNKSIPNSTTSTIIVPQEQETTTKPKTCTTTRHILQSLWLPTTFVGSFMFVLYHVVFCLAMGSSIPNTSSQYDAVVLGPIAKMSCIGIIVASPWFIVRLDQQIPALYATCDLFLAPFLAHLATRVFSALQEEETNNDETLDEFLATFAVLSGIGMIGSALLLTCASKFQLANLSNYLPYPVLCGFFSAVGIMIWSLAFQVDCGHSWQSVVLVSAGGGGTTRTNVKYSVCHHLPSLLIGFAMKWLGPKHPFLVSLLVMTTIACFYLVMFVTGTSLKQAQQNQWFWSRNELVVERQPSIGFSKWAPPAPFGVLHALFEQKVHWGAVRNGLPTACALAFLYFLRCSLHATAVKKNVSNLVRYQNVEEDETDGVVSSQKKTTKQRTFSIEQVPLVKNISTGLRKSFHKASSRRQHTRMVSEAVDLDAIDALLNNEEHGNNSNTEQDPKQDNRIEIRPKTPSTTLQELLLEYSYTQYLVAIANGIAVLPAIAVAPTMYSIGAEGAAPQYGSVLLLLVFYLTDFALVAYIPKAAFSCLLVLASIDMLLTWFIKSYQKTQDKLEWLVVPLIVVFAFCVGLLNAVFLGIGISTLLFVSAFFQTGVVKYVATAITIRSTIERSISSGNWLDQHGDLIQILVIQNYLSFGNSTSILSYITTMFEEPDAKVKEKINFELPPIPKFVILDMSLVTGMDTSTVDVMSDIMAKCAGHDCKLFLCGLSHKTRLLLARGGVKPQAGDRSKRQLRMFPDLDSALGKAEDLLIRNVEQSDQEVIRPRMLSDGDNGFRYALRQIDQQHGTEYAQSLVALHPHTHPVELEPGESLFDYVGQPLQARDRGLFFIESGLMKIERTNVATLSRGSSGSLRNRRTISRSDLTRMNARTGSIGRQVAALKARGSHQTLMAPNLRLARIGPGWVVGTIEGMMGWQNAGDHVAVGHCRLHHLPYPKIEELEKENPTLVLNLYKMLGHLMARRQEITIGQLATLHSIMTSPALSGPTSRETIGRIASRSSLQA